MFTGKNSIDKIHERAKHDMFVLDCTGNSHHDVETVKRKNPKVNLM